MAKTFDEVVYSLCKNYTDQSQLGFKSVKQVANGFEIEYVNGTKATYTVQNMHQHTNMAVLNVLNKDADGNLTFNGKKITNLTADQEALLMKFSLSADNKLLFDGKPIEGGGSGEPYDDTEVRGMINTNKTNISTNTSDISDLTTKIGTETMGTTATTIKGAVKEINGNQLDTVSFSSDYKNIVLNRKNGLNPYSIPIAAIINHAKLIELGDVDTADIGDGKTLMYDAATQKHKYVSSAGTDELVKMDNTSDAKYLVNLLDKQTVVNDNGVLKVKKLDGQEVTIAEINYLKGLTMNVMDLVNTFANGGVKVINTPVATAADLATLDRSKFIDGISYIVYVLADESHAGAKTTYLCDKTNTTFFGNADSQRNFTTNPINLANEVTGKLGTSNIDVDNLWKLLTIDGTYKTLTTKDEVFGTHGAKAMYDELTAAIGNKANQTDFNTHKNDTTIHTTQAEKDSYALKTEVLSADDIKALADSQISENQKNQLKDYYVKLTSNTDMGDFGIDDLSTLTSLLDLTKVLGYHVRFTIQVNLEVTNVLYNSSIIPIDKAGLLILTCEYARGSAIYHTYDNMVYATSTDNSTTIEWRAWSRLLDYSQLTTAIDISSTDAQIPTAKSIYNSIKNKNTIQPTGTIANYSTIFDWAVNNVGATCGYEGNNFTDCPLATLSNTWATLVCIGTKVESGLKVLFCTNFNKDIYTRTIQRVSGTNKWVTSWQKICTTSVADVPKTSITFSDITVYEPQITNFHNHYEVVDGECYVSLYVKAIAPTNQWTLIDASLPKAKRYEYKSLGVWDNGTGNVICTIDTMGRLQLRFGTVGTTYIGTFRYKVAES